MNLKAERIGKTNSLREDGMAFRIIDADTQDPQKHEVAILYHKPLFEDCERLANMMAASHEMLETLLYVLNYKNLGTDCRKVVEQTVINALGGGENDVIAVKNHYVCPHCGEQWDSVWDCSCDDECPACQAKYIQSESDQHIPELFHEEK
jgi:hypothetical protein